MSKHDRSKQPTPQTTDSINPYAPVQAPSAVDFAVRRIRIAKVEHPDGATDCSYFSYEEFAAELTKRMLESCKAIDMVGVVEGTDDKACDATIRCFIHEIKQYRITPLQKFFKLFLPIGYYFYPASFTIHGVIEQPNVAPREFAITRHFEKGRLGEKANMSVGIGSEAMRIVSMAASTLQASTPIPSRGPFWLVVSLVPIAVGALTAAIVYFGWHFVSGEFAGRPSQPNTTVDAIIHAVLSFITTAFYTLGLLPSWVYADRRAAFAYSFASTSKSVVLRIMFFVLGTLTGGLLAASLIAKWVS